MISSTVMRLQKFQGLLPIPRLKHLLKIQPGERQRTQHDLSHHG
jgi:hypothetical protein